MPIAQHWRWRGRWWRIYLRWIEGSEPSYRRKSRVQQSHNRGWRKTKRDSQSADCQVLQVADWATERNLPRLPTDCFETGREHTLNLQTRPSGPRQQMDVRS